MNFGIRSQIARRVMAICLLGLGVFFSLWAIPAAAQSADDTEIQFRTTTYSGEEGTVVAVEVTRTRLTDTGFINNATALIVLDSFGNASAADINAPAILPPTTLTLTWGFDDLGTRTIPIRLIDDGVVEGDETFVLRIADISGAATSIGASAMTSITINDPPSGPNTLVQFQDDAFRGVEGDIVEIMLERVRAPSGTTPVDAAQAIVRVATGGSALVSDDTNFRNPTTVNWRAGDTAPKTISIRLTDDLMTEGSEDFALEIDDVTGDAAIGSPDFASVTIGDANPGQLRFVGQPYRVQEGNTIELQVERFGGSDGQVNVSMGDIQSGAAVRDVDYQRISSSQLNWNDGETGIRIFTYEALSDAESDIDETFEVRDQDGFRNDGPGTATVTIINNAPATPGEVQFTSSSYTGSEADRSLVLTVERVNGSDGAATADYSISAGTAQPGSDFTGPLTGQLSWIDGNADSQSIEIPIVDDDINEPLENLQIELIGSSGAILGTPILATGEILDDDSLMSGVVNFDMSVYDVGEQDGSVVLNVLRTGGSDGDVSVGVQLVEISASFPDDGSFRGDEDFETLIWRDGDSSPRSVTLLVNEDVDATEGQERFDVLLEGVSGGLAIGTSNPTASVFINDGPPPGTPGNFSFTLTSVTVDEADGSVSLSVTRNNGSLGAVSVDYSVVPGSGADVATPGSDFGTTPPPNGTLSWTTGDTTDRTITLDIVNDSESEFDESFALELSNATGGAFVNTGDERVVVTIRDDDPIDSVAFASAAGVIIEGDGLTDIVVQRSGSGVGQVNVSYDVIGESADRGADFIDDISGSVTTLFWANGDLTDKTIAVEAFSDDEIDPAETFRIELSIDSGSGNVDLGTPATTQITITDVPPFSPGVIALVQAYTVSESSQSVRIEATRIGGTDGRVTALYSLGESGDSAELNADYADVAAATGTLVWEDGDGTSKFIDVDIVLDFIFENDEFFTATILDTTGGAGIGNEFSTVTITDTPPPADDVRFAVASDTVLENIGTFDIVVQRVGTGSGDIEVSFDLASGTADLGLDFDGPSSSGGSVSWSDGDLADKTIPITVILDTDDEGDEDFTVELATFSGSGNVNLGTPNVITVTIIDVLPVMPGVLSFNTDYTVSEADGTVSLEVTRSAGADGAVSVDYQTGFASGSDTATGGSDYGLSEPLSGTLNWQDNDATPRFIVFDIAADTDIEGTEQFDVLITGQTGGATINDNVSTVTITDTPPSADTVRFVLAADSVRETDGTIDIVAERAGNGIGAVRVFYELVDGTAQRGADFDVASGTSAPNFFSWADGDLTNKTLSISIGEDTLLEGDETFSVQLFIDSDFGNVSLGNPNETVITIVDAPPFMPGTLQFDPESYTVSELDGSVDLTVTRTGGSDGPLSVSYEVAGGTAILGTDHAVAEPFTGTLMWPNGDDAARTITVDIASDQLVEPDEDFSVALVQGSDGGASLILDMATVTIIDSTQPDSIALADANVEIAEDAGVLSLTVQRTGAGVEAVSVLFSLEDGTAEAGIDYGNALPTSGTVSWAAGDVADKTIEIDIATDNVLDPNETLLVNLSLDPSSRTVTLGSPTQTIVIITDVAPPSPGIVQFDPDQYTVAEADGNVALQVTRTIGSDGPASAQYEVIAGVATAGEDFALTEPVTGVLEWPAGDDTPRTINVDVAADDEVEGEESFSVVLSDVTGAMSGNATTALVNLIDSTEPTPDTLVMADASVSVEENSGTLDIIVQRVGSGVDAVSVVYRVLDDTATGGLDFNAGDLPTGIVAFAAGDTADKTISIDLIDDALVELDETFSVTLSLDASSAQVLIGTPDTTIVTIEDTTPPPIPDVISLAEAEQSQLESESAFTVVILRAGNGSGASSVNWTVSPGSASVTDDIELDPQSGSVNWEDGETGERIVTIPIVADTLDEANETLTFTLSEVQGAMLGSPQSARLTITDDDEPPEPGTIQFVTSSVTVDEDAGTVTLNVSRSNGDDGPLSVVAATVPGSAGIDDFSATQTILEWADGDSTTRRVVVPITFDSIADPSESFAVVLGDATPDDSVLGRPTTATVVINDVFNGNPGTVQFASAALDVDESDASVTVTVTRTGGTDGLLAVNYSTSAGTASSDDDFEATSGTLNWADGDGAPKSFSVAIVADAVSERDEQFTAVLADAVPFGDESIGSPDTVEITINNVELAPAPEPIPDLQPGTVQFVSSTATVDESAGTVSVSVARTGGTDGAVSVRFETADGSAVAGDDFDPASGRLQWADGENDVRIVRIAIDVDELVEGDEQFAVVLNDARPQEEVLGSMATVEVTIVDDSVAPPGVLAFTDTAFTVAEADGSVEMQVSRTNGSAGAVSVGYTTLVRSADEEDFQPSSGRLSWADGDTGIRTIRVPVNRDGLVEPDEQFQVVLAQSEPFGDSQQLGTAVATVTITDSTRLGTLSFVTTEQSVTERVGSTTLSVSRTGGSDGDVSVDYALIGGSAELGVDVVDQGGTLIWTDQDAEPKTIRVLINPDNLSEGNEQFIVALSNARPLGAQQVDRALATITIIDTTVFVDNSTPPLASLGELDLVVVSGDGQSGLPGDLLEPLVIDVVDRAASDTTVADVPILWRAIPEGSAELLEGGRSVSNEDGRTNNRIRILTRGFVRVVATIDVAPPPTSALAARNNPAPFPVGQGEAVFTVRSGIGPAEGLRTNQAAIGNTLDVVCEVLSVRIEQQQAVTLEQQDLFETCQEVEARLVNDDGLGAALDRLIPEELFFIGDSVIDTTDIQVTNVYARINAIRSGQVDAVDLSGLQLNHYDQSIPGSVIEAAQDELYGGGAASADGSLAGSTRLGFFANGSISYGEVDGGENQSDAEFRSSGLTLGADYRATDNTLFGFGIGIVDNDTDFNPDAGSAQVNGLNLTLFGTYFQPDKGYIDAVLDFGRNEIDIERRINLPNTPDQFGVGDTTANVRSLTIGAGRDYRHKNWEFGPYGRLSIIDADIDGFSERAVGSDEGFGSVLTINSHSVQSRRFALGGQISRTLSTRRGVFIPQFRIEAEFENENRKEGIEATFQHDPTQTPFTVNGEDRDSSYINLGVGSSALFPNGRSGFVFYETQQGNERVTQHWLKFGIRLEF